MKKQAVLFTLALMLGGAMVLSTSAPGPVAAERGGIPGKPGGGGGGDDDVTDYGDLIILHRDEFGVPIPSPAVDVTDPETGELVAGGQCWQPIAVSAPDDYGVELYDADGSLSDTELRGVPVDQYTCGVLEATYTQEVDFGRINQARSPASVFESQLDDVVVKLATADSTSLDPAGRMVASTCGPDESTTSTIDSPLQNLAIYRQLMLTGDIGVGLPAGSDFADVLETAARGLGVASDKGGAVDVDLVAYLNQAMGLDVAPTILPKLSQTYRQEVQGTMQLVEKYFLDYSEFGYDRGGNFGALPYPAYIPEGSPQDGWFEYLTVSDPSVPSFTITQGPIMGDVNGPGVFDQVPFSGGNIGGFARAADDTRAVINFMHDWPMPDADVFGTPVPCTYDPIVVGYDVSISDVSGLQVPTQMVDGSEGREFVVTVANAGPDPASGTVTVIALSASGEIVGSPWDFGFIDLPAGASRSFTQFFTVSLGERTTIDWTATVDAEFDVSPANNSATATTNVKVTGGGGGGGRP